MDGASKASDWVLIPVQPSPYDLRATADLIDIIRVRKQITDGRPGAAVIVNYFVAGTVLGTEIQAAVAEHPISVRHTQLVQRLVCPRTAASGQTVFDAKDQTAQTEIAAVADEVLQRIQQQGAKP